RGGRPGPARALPRPGAGPPPPRPRARAEPAARLITAKAEAKANLILRASTSPTVLQYRALERWNGRLPVMNGGGALPLLTFDASKLSKADADDEKLLRELLQEETADEHGKSDKDKADDAGKADDASKDHPPAAAEKADAPKPKAPLPEGKK